MECNKAEAERSLEIAEKLLVASDLSGTKKFAIKAQNMYPPLEGIDQVLAVADVLLAAEKRVNGLMDWYAILQITSGSDDLEMKKQYRKLALLLHPDKNKCAGAETAFKLVVEAWAVLSDSSKKSLYNATANIVSVKKSNSARPKKRQKQTQNRKSKENTKTHKSKKQNCEQTPEQKEPGAGNGFFSGVFAPPPAPNPSTFWTVCPFCFHLYEYLRIHENQNVKCQKCQRLFHTAALPSIPPIVPGTEAYYCTWGCFPLNYSNPNPGFGLGFGFGGFPPMPNSENNQNNQNMYFPWGPFFPPFPSPQTIETQNANNERTVDHQEAKTNDQQNPHSVRYKNGNLAAKTQTGKKKVKSGGAKNSRKRKTLDNLNDVTIVNDLSRIPVDGSIPPFKHNGDDQKLENPIDSCTKRGLNENPNVNEEMSFLKNTRGLLVEKGQMEILKNLPEFKKIGEDSLLATSILEENYKQREKPIPAKLQNKKKVTAKSKENSAKRVQTKKPRKGSKQAPKKKNAMSVEQSKNMGSKKKVKGPTKPKSVETGNGDKNNKFFISDGLEDPLKNSLSIDVPDSDFYNFDQDRRQTCFQEGEIWSIYDEQDGMPRIYARIEKLVSPNPFLVQLKWLVPCDKNRCSCGRFMFGKVITSDVPNLFSHKMASETSSLGCDIVIYPKKSEVWAVHGRLRIASTSSNIANIAAKYQIVEILSDFTLEKGVNVIPLVKVDGFKSVYKKAKVDSKDPDLQWSVTKKRMYKFSHQIPARRVGEEGSLELRGDSWELDPAAIPSGLLTCSDIKKEERKLM